MNTHGISGKEKEKTTEGIVFVEKTISVKE